MPSAHFSANRPAHSNNNQRSSFISFFSLKLLVHKLNEYSQWLKGVLVATCWPDSNTVINQAKQPNASSTISIIPK